MNVPASAFFPSRAAANPGEGSSFEISLRSDERTWTEAVDLCALLLEAVVARGHEARRERDGWIVLPSDGLWLLPQILSLSIRDGGASSSTTIEVAHERLLPTGIFEFQHAVGNSAAESLASGFDLWAQVDLVVFQDALSAELAHCTSMGMNREAEDGEQGGRERRVLFGPVAHRSTQEATQQEKHPFCPCCLFTNTWDAFRPLIESEGVYGLRLYAARDAEGEVQADCRVNGKDWPAGADALRAYVRQWPDRGLEFRKQYVVIQSPPQT